MRQAGPPRNDDFGGRAADRIPDPHAIPPVVMGKRRVRRSATDRRTFTKL
jgi:hypothetical protein